MRNIIRIKHKSHNNKITLEIDKSVDSVRFSISNIKKLGSVGRMQEVKVVEEDQEESYVNDAYEWGRAAGTKLFAQNASISLKFPLGLQNLFSNREFREAMLIGGVLSDKIVSLPTVVPTAQSSISDSDEDDEEIGALSSFESQSKKRLLAIQDRRNSQQVENSSNGVIIAPSEPEEPEAIEETEIPSTTAEQIRCLCCRSAKIVMGRGRRRDRLRELLWCSLGLDKYYERPTHPFPFCRRCERRLEEMEEICEEMKILEERFEKCREGLSTDVLEQLLTIGEVAKNAGTDDPEMDTSDHHHYFHPGRELLEKVDSLCELNTSSDNLTEKYTIKNHASKRFSKSTKGNKTNAPESTDLLMEPVKKRQLFECPDCSRKFTTKHAEARHRTTLHKKEQSFKCKVCNKSFSRNDSLQFHEKTHSGDKPFTCSECGKTFSHRSNFTDHMRRHSGEKPFKCSLCTVTYNRTRAFKAHFKHEHPGTEISYVRVRTSC